MLRAIHAQVSPVGGVLTPLLDITDQSTYGNALVTIKTIMVTNVTEGLGLTFRIALAFGGAADATSQYLYYDIPLEMGVPFRDNPEIIIQRGDVMRVWASSDGANFQVFGTMEVPA